MIHALFRQPQSTDERLATAAIFGTASLIAATGYWFFYLWIGSDAAWLHPEMLGSASYVWLYPGQESIVGMLRKFLDWKAFDPNVNRIRIVNDGFEVIDALARPYFTTVIGPKVSVTPSTVLTVLCAPWFFWMWIRRTTGNAACAFLATLLLVSSIGFLSNTVAYLHPAKRINFVLLCAALYFAQAFLDRQRWPEFIAMCASLWVALFTDELGIANFAIVGMVYWRAIARQRAKLVVFLAIPLAFVITAKYGLPAIYTRFSVHGHWDAFQDPKKLALLTYVLEPDFYIAALRQTARSLLATFGIQRHTVATEGSTVCLLLLLAGIYAYRHRFEKLKDTISDQRVSLGLSFIALSFYATFLDWYPFPYEISYLGSFNYYYHSPIPILAIGWLAAIAKPAIANSSRYTTWMVGVVAVVVTSNFLMFEKINVLARYMHLQPFANAALLRSLDEARLANAATPPIEVTADANGEAEQFAHALRAVFGDDWIDNGFYQTFHSVLDGRPLMGEPQIRQLFHVFFPRKQVRYRLTSVKTHARVEKVRGCRTEVATLAARIGADSSANCRARHGIA